MKKLISMVEFILERSEIRNAKHKMSETLDDYLIVVDIDYIETIERYANFLKQPLQLGFFVPCDSDGNFLDDLQMCCNGRDCGCMGLPVNVTSMEEIKQYQEAEERVLFEGFELIGENLFTARVANGRESFLVRDIETEMNIEDLVKYNLVLTESAKKQIGL